MPGIHFEVSDDCLGCGDCTKGVCFIDVIHIEKGRAVIGADCRGCGKCVDACPIGAIRLVIDDADFMQQAVSHLSERVDFS